MKATALCTTFVLGVVAAFGGDARADHRMWRNLDDLTGPVAVGGPTCRSDDQDDLGDARLGARSVRGRRDKPDGDQSGQECDDHPSHDGLYSTTGNPQRPAVTPRSARRRA